MTVTVKPADFGFQAVCSACGPKPQPDQPTHTNVAQQADAHAAFHQLKDDLLDGSTR